MKYIVKWKHVESNNWRNFYPKPKVFDSFQKAQNFMRKEFRDSLESYDFKVFEHKSKKKLSNVV